MVNGPVTGQSPPAKWYRIESDVLGGEEILYVPDRRHLDEARAAYPDLAIYLPPEIVELNQYRDAPDVIREAHRIKKAFRGWIVPLESRLGRWLEVHGRRAADRKHNYTSPALESAVLGTKIRRAVCPETKGVDVVAEIKEEGK